MASASNYWNFTKTAGTSKINWTLPIDLSSLSFQDLQSVWAIVRFNTTTGNIATEGIRVRNACFKFNPQTTPQIRQHIEHDRITATQPTLIHKHGYTLALVQSVALNTASNILAYNFDVISSFWG